MALATVDGQGSPSVRMVLLKQVDEQGFVFYTNLRSRKARQLAIHPHAALCFFWEPLMEQVRIEGRVEQVSDKEADAYWASRPRSYKLGSWASRQSAPLDHRGALARRVIQYAMRFSGKSVPRPRYWSGVRVVPARIAFWRMGAFRLREGVLYESCGKRWIKRMLCP